MGAEMVKAVEEAEEKMLAAQKEKAKADEAVREAHDGSPRAVKTLLARQQQSLS